MIQKKDITAIILAGGKSTRMGADKGWINLNGATFMARIIDTVRPLVSTIIIVSDDARYDQFGTKRVADIIPNAGPMAGIFSGLFYSETALNLILSCDVPMINDEVLIELFKGNDPEKDVVQVQSLGKTMPLIALYKKQCMHPILASLKSGERRLTSVVRQLNTKTIVLDTKLENKVRNINTLEDLKQLQHELKH